MSASPASASDSRAGVVYATACYIIWGIIPIYWRWLEHVPPFELVIHRILWCFATVLLVVALQRRLSIIGAVFRNKKLLGTLALTSVLISINWGIYIWCIASEQLVEASLGYYINPLVSVALGVVLLGERMTNLRLAAVALATIAVVLQTFTLGHFPWIALTLAFSFGLYGYFRKIVPVEAVEGLLIETIILFPIVTSFIMVWTIDGTGTFPAPDLLTNVLLVIGGPLTALPLALFSAGARRIRLSTLGFLQYLSPSITLVLATVYWGEPFTVLHAITFGLIWLALALISAESLWQQRFIQPAE
jgi:chloramphenicol-sensitive protein RarD